MRYPLIRTGDASEEAETVSRRTRRAMQLIAAAILLSPSALPGSATSSVAPTLTAEPTRPLILKVQGHGQPAINVSKIILAEPASETPLPIQVGPPNTIARNSFIRVQGLPPAAALTEGHSIAPGAWAIPLMALANLKIVLPIGSTGKSDISVALVTIDGTVLAEAKTALVIAAASLIAPNESEPRAKSVASLGPDTREPPRSQGQAHLGPASSTISDEQKRAQSLLRKGEEQLALGSVAAARLFFQRAAEADLAQGAFAMAATYDPVELDRIGARSVQPNVQEARRWYERAHQLGAAEAEDRLQRLGAR